MWPNELSLIGILQPCQRAVSCRVEDGTFTMICCSYWLAARKELRRERYINLEFLCFRYILTPSNIINTSKQVIKQNNYSTEDMDQSMDAVSHLADTKTATGNSLEMSGQNPIERTVPSPWAAVSRAPIRKQTQSRHVSSVVVRQDLYAKRKVMYQTNPTYQRRKSNEPDDASPGTTTQKDDRVTNSYCDALRYGQNVGRVLAQLSPQRRHAVMIKIDEILLDTAKERYQQHYGTDP